MLQTSQPAVFSHLHSWHQQPARRSGVARCLFGKPNPADTKRQLDDELSTNYKRFTSRYEICQQPDRRTSSLSANNNNNLVKTEESRRKRIESSSAITPKRQKLLTDFWPKSKDSSNSKYKKSS